MRFLLTTTLAAVGFVFSSTSSRGQDAAAAAKPTEHLVGTVTAANADAQTVRLKEDAAGTEHLVQLSNTKTLLKVAPGAKDLKAATRITAADLAPGDRIDIRGFKVESDPSAIAAKSLVLMSSRDLQQAHQSETSAWQKSTGGTVASIDSAAKKITITVRGADGPKPVVVEAGSAVFTRYSPEHPKSADPSQFGDVQTGDQVKVIGEKNADGTLVTAQKIYSGSFKTIAGTVSSIAVDGKSMVVKDLTTKQSVTVALNDESGIHKLPPMIAMMLAKRFNPDMKNTTPGAPPSGSAPGTGAPAYGAKAGETNGEAAGARSMSRAPEGGNPNRNGAGEPSGPGGGPGSPGGFRGGRMAGGDLSQMLDRLPKISTSELKNGDAVVVSGSPSAANKATLLATSVIAGVEPIFQSASGRQAQSLGDWGASLGGGAAMDSGAPLQ